MNILRGLFLTNAAIAGSMLLNSCGGVPKDMPPISGLQAYVKASNTGAADEFGFAVALSIDGNTLAVGAPGEASAATGIIGANQTDNTAANAGAVYVFTRSVATWSQQAYVKASNTGAADNFGSSVALSGRQHPRGGGDRRGERRWRNPDRQHSTLCRGGLCLHPRRRRRLDPAGLCEGLDHWGG